MLVITRNSGQKTLIHVPPSAEWRTIVIEIVEIKYDFAVKLGIQADKDVEIVRDNARKQTP